MFKMKEKENISLTEQLILLSLPVPPKNTWLIVKVGETSLKQSGFENPHYIKQQAKQSKQFCFSDEVIHLLSCQVSKEYKPRR